MKVFVVVWSLSGHIRVVGIYTNYNTAEEKIKEMQRNSTQGWIKIIESEVYTKPIVMEELDTDMKKILQDNQWELYD